MIRRLDAGTKIVIATHNAGKLREIRDLLAPFDMTFVSAGDLGLGEPAETGHMFAENAAIKAHSAAKAAGLPALSDDSGLCADALDGAPGLFSADWAGPTKNFDTAMARVQQELLSRGATASLGSAKSAGSLGRGAHFVSALVLAWPDGHQVLFEGRVFGEIVWPPRGSIGFGYDPMFQPNGHARTFGEMTAEEKHGIDWGPGGKTGLSHRARAFRNFAEACLPKRVTT
jgi:XTP/dITP diphosphohydrolase